MENIHQGHREKMRQRFLKSGLEGFADHEALELLLYYAIPRQDTNPIAHRLMDRYGSLTAVLIGAPWVLMTSLSDKLIAFFDRYLPGGISAK